MSDTGSAAPQWKVSLHGGHSGDYCDHAKGTLREILEAASDNGFHTYGVSEHAPRLAGHLLYETEREWGWDVAKLKADFERYAEDSVKLVEEFADRLVVLRGFEAEVAPASDYVEIMTGLREKFLFDYIVGSVHFINETIIDGPAADFEKAMDHCGGLEQLCIAYYRSVAEMVHALDPEVVGHLDLVRKNAPSNEAVETPAIKSAAREALKAIQEHDCILDLNTAGYRKGLGTPYPAPWLLREANEMGVGFCFGDDSHEPEQVGAGIEEARQYLLDHGIGSVTILTKENGTIIKKSVPLDS